MTHVLTTSVAMSETVEEVARSHREQSEIRKLEAAS
jgi:hypothetical protein